MQVGIRELKAKLSAYIERVKQGETVIITDRGRGVAMIVPLPGRDAIERGLAEGWLTRADDRARRPLTRTFKPRPGAPSTTETIRADRDA